MKFYLDCDSVSFLVVKYACMNLVNNVEYCFVVYLHIHTWYHAYHFLCLLITALAHLVTCPIFHGAQMFNGSEHPLWYNFCQDYFNITLLLRLTPGVSSLFILSRDTVFISYGLCHFPGYFYNFMLSYSCAFFPAFHF